MSLLQVSCPYYCTYNRFTVQICFIWEVLIAIRKSSRCQTIQKLMGSRLILNHTKLKSMFKACTLLFIILWCSTVRLDIFGT